MTGEEGMIGQTGVALSEIYKDGRIQVRGEYWNAFSNAPIKEGSRVRVTKMHGLRLEVEPADES
jgi:membrane-bound serine protease (ClpP class)